MGGFGGNAKSDSLRAALEAHKSRGESSLSDYQRQLIEWTRNVDKRYAWVVLVALWIMMAASLGPYRIYGLIFAKVTETGVYTREQATWPVAMIFTVENLFGPLVSIVTYYISFRQSLLIGSLLLTLGNAVTYLSASLWMDVLFLGFVQGAGYAFIFMPFMEIINQYFLKYRNIALGFALCGGTVSVFVWSPLARWILDSYDNWRVAYLAIGAICALNLAMIPLLRPNPRPRPQASRNLRLGGAGHLAATPKRPADIERGRDGEPGGGGARSLSRLSLRALSYQNSIRRQTTMLITRKTSISRSGLRREESIISLNPFASTAGLERQISRTITDYRPRHTRPTPATATATASEASAASAAAASPTANGTGTGNAADPCNICEKKTQQVQQADCAASHLQQAPTELYSTLSLNEVGQDSEFDINVIWNILKTPAFHLITYNELVYFWVFSIYCLVLADLGVDRGCSRAEADLLFNYQSIGEMIGRLGLTILVDLRFLSNKNVVILVLVLLGSLLVGVTQVSGFMWMATITGSLSATAALLYITLNGLLVDYLGERQVTMGYGLSSCIAGFFMFFRPQAVGFFRDYLGSYDLMMISLGGSCFLGAALWIIEPLITRLVCKCRAEPQTIITPTIAASESQKSA